MQGSRECAGQHHELQAAYKGACRLGLPYMKAASADSSLSGPVGWLTVLLPAAYRPGRPPSEAGDPDREAADQRLPERAGSQDRRGAAQEEAVCRGGWPAMAPCTVVQLSLRQGASLSSTVHCTMRTVVLQALSWLLL